MTLRAAVPADAAAMMAIYNEAIVDHVHANCDVLQSDAGRFGAGYLVDVPACYGVYVDESPTGEICGWGALKKFSAFPHCAEIAEVAVYIGRDRRSRGLGIRLLQQLQAHARGAGLHSLVAIILEHNRSSIRGSEHCGFQTCVVLPKAARFSDQYEDIIWMQCNLTPSTASRPGRSTLPTSSARSATTTTRCDA
jgi:L-amino acid N-acyltransferase YncA